METPSINSVSDLNWKFVGLVFAVALAACIIYDRVLRDYIPGGSKDTTV